MHIHRRWWLVVWLLPVAALACGQAFAQQPSGPEPAAAPAPAKPSPKHKPAAAPKTTAPKPAAPAGAAAAGGAKPTLLGQYGEWGAYTASPGGKKICFAIAKPTSATTNPPNRPRNPIYMFISTRPADKITSEVSIIIGYPFKPGSEASVAVGATSFALYTQQDGAWIKNAADEANLVEAMRAGDTAVVKGESARGTQSTDTFSLKGLTQALDKVGQTCQ